MKLNYKQVTFAREYRGLTQTQLAKKIDGLSQSNLSKFEKGLDILSNKVTDKIIKELNFPKKFFFKLSDNPIEFAHYRKRTTISKKMINRFEQMCLIYNDVVDEMTHSIEWPDYALSAFDLREGFTPESCAKFTRRALGLSKGEPVEEIFKLLESSGIIIFEADAEEKIDGVSFVSNKGYPVIVINKNFSNDRKRFTLAHELGHIIMHYDYPIPDYREKKLEKEANAFAAEFLMPADQIKNSLYYLKLNDLNEFKKHWLTSMKSIIYRAYELDCLSKEKYKYFYIEFSRMGYNKKEPFDVYIDKPVLFKKAYKLFKEELDYTKDDFSRLFGLPDDVIDRIFDFDNRKVLRVVR